MASQDNIQDILDSVKIPCQPPNKSQWKKLEIAVKFINASKKSAEQKRYFFYLPLRPALLIIEWLYKNSNFCSEYWDIECSVQEGKFEDWAEEYEYDGGGREKLRGKVLW